MLRRKMTTLLQSTPSSVDPQNPRILAFYLECKALELKARGSVNSLLRKDRLDDELPRPDVRESADMANPSEPAETADDTAALFSHARAMREQGQFDAADAALQQLVQQQPDHVP